MGHVADLVAQVGDVELAQVEVVEEYLAFVGGIEPHHQAGQGAFARAAATDDADTFARLDAEAHAIERGGVLSAIAKGDMADLEGAVQLCALQRLLASLALLGQGHKGVGAAHGQLRLLVASDQPGDLPQWGQYPAAEHITGHQGTDAEVAGDDAVDAGNDGCHAAELLDEQRAIGGQGREIAGVGVEAGEGAVGAFPLVLALAFSTAGLEGFKATQGLDQQGLAHGTERQAFLYGVAQAHLDEQRKENGHRKGDQRNHHQPATEQADDQEHQHHEGQVDDAGQGHGGEKLAQPLEVMDALGKSADGGRAGFHRHAGDAFEQGGGKNQVGFFAGLIEQVGADHAQYQFKEGADQQAGDQDPQGREGLVGHHPIVGLHDEQRHHQAEQVDQQAGKNGIAVQPARQLERIAKPGIDPWHQRCAQVFEFMPGASEQRLATVGLVQFLAADPLLAAFGLAGQDQQSAVIAKAPQHGTSTFLEQQQHRQVERRDGAQFPAQHPCLQACAGGSPGQKLQAKALLCQGQAGAEASARDRATMQLAENQQSIE
ncbi:hypothetical protein D3C77_64550 [compost metagenome]